MATKDKNISFYEGALPSAAGLKFGIVVSGWNAKVTHAMMEGAIRTLRAAGCDEKDIVVRHVPGAFELALAAQFFAEYTDVDAVIVLGCVIQGETRHFDFVCQSVTQGVTEVMLTWNMPVAFGVLTTENMQQALDRAGGKLGNKGDEAAETALRMIALQVEMEESDTAPEINRNERRNNVN